MNIIGIDPGTNESGGVIYDEATHTVVSSGVWPNDSVRNHLRGHMWGTVVVERIVSMGMQIGQTTIDTIQFIGRIQEICEHEGLDFQTLTRGAVKLHLCGTARAKDPNVRSVVKDRFPHTGGGADPVKGTKKQPGPLYGVSSHCWQALALAITYCETNRARREG